MTHLKINKKIVAERYDQYAGRFEAHVKSMGVALEEQVADYLGDKILSGSTLLDVAGGDGLSTSRLDVAKVSIVVMDMSTGMLAAAKELRSNIAETIEGDFDDKFPFRDCTFDYVTCISALEFAADLRFTLGEMMRVVKPGGLLLFTTDCLEIGSPIQNERIYVHDKRGFFSRRYKTEEVLDIICSLGGKTVSQGTHNAYRLEEEWVKYDYFLVGK